MKTGTALFDFKVDRQRNKVRVKREFNAPVSRVWDAFTRSDLLDEWWAPKPWKARTKSMEFREGGHWLYAMIGPDGSEQWCRADFKSIQPEKLFSAMDAFCDIDGNIDTTFPSPVWNVKFNTNGSSTIVDIEISFENPEDLQKYIESGFQEGFSAALENLDELLL